MSEEPALKLDPMLVNVPFVVVDDADGRILQPGTCLRRDLGNQGIGRGSHQQYVVEGTYDAATIYFLDYVETSRPALLDTLDFAIAADGIAEVAFEVPDGTLAIYVAADGLRTWAKRPNDGLTRLRFRTVLPGTYFFELTPPFPAAEQTVRIVAR